MQHNENNKEQERLLEELLVINKLIKENPCGMSIMTMKGIVAGLRSLFRMVDMDMNLEQVSKYFRVDPRTIRRWRKEYDDFPEGKKCGDNNLSFPADKIVEWKIKHKK